MFDNGYAKASGEKNKNRKARKIKTAED